MKFIKPFKGATGGNPYPTDFNIGDECPEDLIHAAIQVGAVERPKAKAKTEKE
ncbi:hypothetical protein [Paenochrobactrum sp. BZR 201-1]